MSKCRKKKSPAKAAIEAALEIALENARLAEDIKQEPAPSAVTG